MICLLATLCAWEPSADCETMFSFDGLINSLVFWLSSLSLGLSNNGTHSLEYKVPYRNRPGRTEIWSSCNGGRFPECC